MSGYPVTPDDAERPPSPGWSMLKRFLLAAVLIVLLSGAGSYTLVNHKITVITHEVFTHEIRVPNSVVSPVYNGGPQTFLILGSDRRVGSKDALDRTDPPHSDTILLVRFDPSQGQTSVLSIPRDLMVNIMTKGGQSYPKEKINAAYTIGNRLGGTKGGMQLAAETIEHEVFPGLTLNGIVDVSFSGFINVVDTLGCAYVNVDHHYYNPLGTGFTAIDIQPGYQKLCYEKALSYVRYRHTDSDFVRVARQQDFIRDLREQISPGNVLGQIDTVAKSVGRAISSTFHASNKELIELAKLIAFSQTKPLRQVKFETSNVNFAFNGGSYVTTTPGLAQATLSKFLNGHEQLKLPAPARPSHSSHNHHSHPAHTSLSALNLFPDRSVGDSEEVKAALGVPFPALYPTIQTGEAEQQEVRAYTLKDQQGNPHHAYVVAWEQNTLGGYYDFEGTDWLNPPLFAHARIDTINGRSYRIVDDGAHIHVVGWRSGNVLYWVTNTLLEELSNAQMLAIAKSAQPLH
jgi:polyisoprenyl-teichoic acid--peptidoglycan teichoic acid transferase